MNRYATEKERQTSIPILHFKNAPYIGFNLHMLMSFEVSTVTTMDSQEPACCDSSHLLSFLAKLPYKARFGGAKFGRG